MGRVRATFGGLLFLFYFNFLSIFGGVFNNYEMIIANSALPVHARGIILKHMENHMSAREIRNILISHTDIHQIFNNLPRLFCQYKEKRKMGYSWATCSRLNTWVTFQTSFHGSKGCHTVSPTLYSHWPDWIKHCSEYYVLFWLNVKNQGVLVTIWIERCEINGEI